MAGAMATKGSLKTILGNLFFRLPKWVIFCHFKNRQAMCELLKAWVWRQDAMKMLTTQAMLNAA